MKVNRNLNAVGFWKEINKLRKGNKDTVTRIDGIQDPKSICKKWREKFLKIGKDLNNNSGEENFKLEQEVNKKDNGLTEKTTDYKVDMEKNRVNEIVEKWEVQNCLKKLKVGKARGPDGICSEQLKWGGTMLWNWISKLMVRCFSHSLVFKETVDSWILPIVKDFKGNVEDSDNYRGISVSSVWSKIVDTLILEKLQNRYKIKECQFGFKKGVSAGMAVQTIIELREKYSKNGGSLFCAFVDLKKAFDKLKYNSVWDRVKKIKGGNNVCKMIKEMYLEQKKKVCWNKNFSDSFQVDVGVKQGSPLSPFLFAIVMDEVIEEIHELRVGCEIDGMKINIIVYADDIVLLGPTKMAIQKMLKLLIRVLKLKGLEVNKEKTVAMEFKKGRKVFNQSNIKTEVGDIKWVTEIKYLGIFLQSDCNWNKHLQGAVNKMNKMGNMILQQVGNVVEIKDRTYLLNCCAFDLYGVEFCNLISCKDMENARKSYHWLVKRCLGRSKFYGNHAAAVESGLLTWDMNCKWKEVGLWENIQKSQNEIMAKLFKQRNKWETELGKKVRQTLIDFGRDLKGVKGVKENMMMFIEAMAVLKEREE